jgi:hypothetical protein
LKRKDAMAQLCYGSVMGVKSWGLELENTKFSRYVRTKHGD